MQSSDADPDATVFWVALLLFAATAVGDVGMTVRGMQGDLALEGNPILRGLMGRVGILQALTLQKALTGLVTAFVARRGARAIRRREPWIWRVPMTPWVRRWMQRGDRSWIAFIPIAASITAQVLAVVSWAMLTL